MLVYTRNLFGSPVSITKKFTTRPWDPVKSPALIKRMDSVSNFVVQDLDNNVFSSYQTGTETPHRSVTIEQEESVFFPTDNEIQKIAGSKGFVTA